MEPGCMVHADDGVKPVTSLQNPLGAFLADEDILRLKWKNDSSTDKTLSAAAMVPSKIIPIDLSVYRCSQSCVVHVRPAMTDGDAQVIESGET